MVISVSGMVISVSGMVISVSGMVISFVRIEVSSVFSVGVNLNFVQNLDVCTKKIRSFFDKLFANIFSLRGPCYKKANLKDLTTLVMWHPRLRNDSDFPHDEAYPKHIIKRNYLLNDLRALIGNLAYFDD
jgi:hypothetical protein